MADQPLPPALLTLPPELRNQIYHLLFVPSAYLPATEPPSSPRRELLDFGKDATYKHSPRTAANHGPLLLTCRQMHHETHLIYLASTLFHLRGNLAEPYCFESQLANLSPGKSSSIRHIVLTAKIAHLCALNETWNGLPFGNASLDLDTLTLLPKKPVIHGSSFADVADLSQSHRLAHILAETLKSLRNVRMVVVRNEQCFASLVWSLVYRSLVYRLWRWGGGLCDLGFRELEHDQGFEILIGMRKVHGAREMGWRDVLEEVNRLIGAEGSRDGMTEETGLAT